MYANSKSNDCTVSPELDLDITTSTLDTIAPFLSKHIPNQYAPQNIRNENTKYCYRHRPDIQCRRQADEPSMEELQKNMENLSTPDQQAISHIWALFSAAPGSLRTLMLQGILAQCCFPQLSFISASLRDLIRIDFLTALPPELSYKVLSYLDTTSLCKAAQVSRRWRALADDDVVWHKMCEQHIDRKCTKCGWGLPLLERRRLRATKRQIEFRAKGQSLTNNDQFKDVLKHSATICTKRKKISTNEASYDAEDIEQSSPKKRQHTSTERRSRPWKDIYSERFKVESNWRRGRCTTKIFKGHTNGIMCLQFDENILATGSYDATIKIWDLESSIEIRTLKGHTSGIRALQFDDSKLISGSLDTTLKIWNWRTGECLNTLTGHGGGIISLHFDAKLVASGSVDKTVKLWNFTDKSCVALRGHTDWVNSVKIHSSSGTLFSASDDTTVRMWDLNTKECLRIFHGHVGQVQQVLPITLEPFEDVDMIKGLRDLGGLWSSISHTEDRGEGKQPTHILTAALDSTIKLWDVASGKCVKTLFGHVEGVWALAADSLRVISGAEDRMVKVWDIRTGKCQRTITGHSAPVTCLALSDSRMITAGEDCEARMYSFKADINGPGTESVEVIGSEIEDNTDENDS